MNIEDELESIILSKVRIDKLFKYIPFGDGEQNHTVIVDNDINYRRVCKKWNNYYEKKRSNSINKFFNLF